MNATPPAYELLFQALHLQGRALSFPCDAEGHVDLDGLPEQARLNYLYARVVVGHEFAWPVVRAVVLH
ncbi:hypothetical protein H8N03_05295 [Ramlibacter sp. USB13]|uniref:Uncharacterized protein n=1 Tax=Ramlibacter cellulosilyticus TaxID=2764187 RepID=A0A923SA34_9BURK|nr:hypothetical protein [Ramlibacter cellulosilyticus]MBC5782349.1 hypothetical protein [Ramlibacter cellulosilyticus]